MSLYCSVFNDFKAFGKVFKGRTWGRGKKGKKSKGRGRKMKRNKRGKNFDCWERKDFKRKKGGKKRKEYK